MLRVAVSSPACGDVTGEDSVPTGIQHRGPRSEPGSWGWPQRGRGPLSPGCVSDRHCLPSFRSLAWLQVRVKVPRRVLAEARLQRKPEVHPSWLRVRTGQPVTGADQPLPACLPGDPGLSLSLEGLAWAREALSPVGRCAQAGMTVVSLPTWRRTGCCAPWTTLPQRSK